jgi:hypothetical protein
MAIAFALTLELAIRNVQGVQLGIEIECDTTVSDVC